MTLGLRWGVLLGATGILLAACGSGQQKGGGGATGGSLAGHGGGGGANGGGPGTLQVTFAGQTSKSLDLLFMIDNSSSMTLMQQKLAAQIPALFQVLEALPNGLPDLHIGVVSSDMGAPGDQTANIGCTPHGDNGMFQYSIGAASTTCTATTLSQGATFISDVGGTKNFTDPIETVLQCIMQIGSAGCGFEHQLASIDRALGADMTPVQPPSTNAGFLRTDASLGIVLLTNEDDCSAPPNTTIYSLNGGADSITNPDGPIANYRCNGGPRGAHSCKDPSGNMIVPPLNPPVNATGSPPILNLTDCQDNQTGSSAFVPVSQFVADIKKLKTDPDNQILVAAITAPADPYGVTWVQPPSPPPGTTGQLWPQIMHSCGAASFDDVNPMATQVPTDSVFGDPAVRVSQFVGAFHNNVLASVCDSSYATAMTAIATKLGQLVAGQDCAAGTIQTDPEGSPNCTVVNHLADSNGNTMDVPVVSCAENGAVAPCWTLTASTSCPGGGLAFKLVADAAAQNAASLSSTLTCTLCQPGVAMSGCPAQ